MYLLCLYFDLVCNLLFCATIARKRCLKQVKLKDGVIEYDKRSFFKLHGHTQTRNFHVSMCITFGNFLENHQNARTTHYTHMAVS